MTEVDLNPIVEDYMRRLAAALERAPAAVRNELTTEIRGHIEEARADLVDETPADVLNILDRVGEPSQIVAIALDEARPRRRLWRRPVTWGGCPPSC